MYFSAACLIGMRPLLHPIVARLPASLKNRVLHPTGHAKASTFGQDTSERLRLKSYRHRSQYASMQDGEDLESGLRQPMTLRSDAAVPGSQYHGRDPYMEMKDNSRSEIRVETNIEVRRDDGSYHRRHETAEPYKFPSPIRAN